MKLWTLFFYQTKFGSTPVRIGIVIPPCLSISARRHCVKIFFSRRRRTTFPSTHFLLQPYLLLQPTRPILAETQQHAAVPEDLGEPCCSRPARTHRRSEGKRVHKASQGKDRRCCKSAVLDKLT